MTSVLIHNVRIGCDPQLLPSAEYGLTKLQ